MWERLLFLLLCAHLVQFNGSDSFKYDNKNELNKTSSYLIADQFIYREESLNESYSKSGMGKIRRVRSIENDLKIAEQKEEKLMKENEDAKKQLNESSQKLNDKLDEIKKTEDYLFQINGELEKATEFKKQEKETLQTADTYLRIRITLFEEAKEAYASSTIELKKITDKSRIMMIVYEESGDHHTKADKIKEKAEERKNNAFTDVGKARNELEERSTSLKTKEMTLKNAIATMNKDIKLVEDVASLTIIEDEMPKAKKALSTAKEKKTESNKKKTPLGEMKTWMTTNTLFTKPELLWKEQTVVNLIDKCTDMISQANLDITKGINLVKAKDVIEQQTLHKKKLEELKTKLKYTGKIMDLVKDVPDMLLVLRVQIDAEDYIIKNAELEIKELDNKILTDIPNRINKRKDELKVEHPGTNFKDEAVKAKIREKDNPKNVAKARVEFVKQKEKMEEQEAVIEPLNDAYLVDAIVYAAKTIQEKKAAEDKSYLGRKNGQATTEFDNYSKEFDNVKQAHGIANTALTNSKEAKIDSERRHTDAEATMDLKIKEKGEAIVKLGKEELERDVLIGVKKGSESTAFYALNATLTANGEVLRLRTELKDFNTKEEERRGVVRMLKWGLGTTGGILVLLVIGGILAFVLIRRKKKAVKEKKPTRIEFKTEEGLTCIRREGEYDHYCIKGEDFKVMGPLFRGRVHNTIPTKHLLDDQVGGDKIDKITFPTELNEAYFIGEGVEHCEPDSVSISESKGDLFDGIDVSQSKKGKKDKDEKGNEKDAKMNVKDSKGSAPPSSEEKKSDEKNKSKRASDANAKNGPSSAPDGGNKTEQQQKK